MPCASSTRASRTLTVDATYLNQVNRVFGPDSRKAATRRRVARQRRVSVSGRQAHRVRLPARLRSAHPLPRANGRSSAALIPMRVSTETYGVRLSGERAVGPTSSATRPLTRTQSDYGSNPLRFDLDYYSAELIGTYRQ